MSASSQRRTWSVILMALAAGSFLLTVVVSIWDVAPRRSIQADSLSSSALGHRIFVDLLRRLEVPVTVSRYRSGHRSGSDSLLVLAEPRLHDWSEDRQEWLEESLDEAERVLVILPKRRATGTHERRQSWAGGVEEVSEGDVQRTLDTCVGPGHELARPERVLEWLLPETDPEPELSQPQLIGSDTLEAWIGCEHGILLGKHPQRDLWVLSDPDLLANHGITDGRNAELVVDLIERIRQGRPLVLDEELHGFRVQPSVWQALFRQPLVWVLLQALLVCGCFLWSGLVRFGAPREVGATHRVAKDLLIQNVADLLQVGRKTPQVLGLYLDQTLVDLGQRLGAPDTRDPAALAEWLQGALHRRGSDLDLAALRDQLHTLARQTRSPQTRLVDAARSIHQLRQELVRGRGQGTGFRKPAA